MKACLLAAGLIFCLLTSLFSATGDQGAVATVQPIATEAAIAAMKKGGNAIDGAVAAALTLGVVDGHNSGIGGGCFLLIRLADGTTVAIDGRETAPAAADRNMFVRNGKAAPELSQTGALASGVPGSLAAYDYVLRKYGKLSLKDHLLEAAAIAERGFKIDASYARALASEARELTQVEASRKIFLRPNGSPYKQGDLLKQLDLAATYRHIADEGTSWFYRGPFARGVEQWMNQHAGLMKAADFARYEIRMREPVTNSYRGYLIVGFPPPSSGGVHVAQILNILEHFPLQKFGPASVDFVHVTAESMKLAFADRAFWLGDPDFARVPRGLVSKKYAATLAARIQME